MAKKGKRILIILECTVCKNQNYTSEKSKVNTQERIKLNKYCPHERKVTEHVEIKK